MAYAPFAHHLFISRPQKAEDGISPEGGGLSGGDTSRCCLALYLWPGLAMIQDRLDRSSIDPGLSGSITIRSRVKSGQVPYIVNLYVRYLRAKRASRKP